MAHPDLVTAVEARLEAEWTLCPIISINDAEATLPENGLPWVALQYPVADTRRAAVNQRVYLEEGVIRFVLHMERGEGIARPLQWANQLAGLFRDRQFDGVRTKVPASPFVDDTNDTGNYFVVSVVVPYTFEFRDEE